MSEPLPDDNNEGVPPLPATPQKFQAKWLPWMILWGLSPAIALTLSGVAMELDGKGPQSELGTVFMMLGLLGGPIALLAWSARVLWWTSMDVWAKVLLALVLTVVACTVNFFLAMGACAIIDPPMNFH